MIIPKKVRIATFLLKVLFPHAFQERTDIFGRYDLPSGNIMITDVNVAGGKCSPTYIAITFFHEVLHVIDITYCLGLLGTECSKESLLDGLAMGIVRFLEANFEPLIPKKRIE